MATFGNDDEIIDLLERGELDVAVTSTTPARRSIASAPIDTKRFVLVAPPDMIPTSAPGSIQQLASWLVGKPWVAYSAELPMTRRFWQSELGRPFAADLRLIAPDLRAVVRAVEGGHGISLLPTFVCPEELDGGSIVELFPASDGLPEEPWFACTRVGDLGRDHIGAFTRRLATPRDGSPNVRWRAHPLPDGYLHRAADPHITHPRGAESSRCRGGAYGSIYFGPHPDAVEPVYGGERSSDDDLADMPRAFGSWKDREFDGEEWGGMGRSAALRILTAGTRLLTARLRIAIDRHPRCTVGQQ